MYTQYIRRSSSKKMAPEAGLEPATRRLTAGCSTIELLWNSDRWFVPFILIHTPANHRGAQPTRKPGPRQTDLRPGVRLFLSVNFLQLPSSIDPNRHWLA